MAQDAKYIAAFENLMRLEGGKTKDTGGWTNYGITLRNLLDSDDMDFDKDHDGDLDKQDLWAFTKDDARLYIYKHWWLPGGFPRVMSPEVASKMLDICYNVGMPRGIRITQRALNDTRSRPPWLDVDGDFGPLTLTAINTTSPLQLVENLRNEQKAWYMYLVTSKPAKYGKYRKGWLRRAAT